jgi:hypothetical protein
MILSWQQELSKLNTACHRVPDLVSVLLTLHPTYFYHKLRHPDKVLASLGAIDAAPILRAEILGRERVEPYQLKAKEDAQD